MSKYCRKCGKQLADSAKFCAGCGTPVLETGNQGAMPNQYQQNVAQKQVQKPAKKKKGGVFVAIAGILAVIVVACIVINSMNGYKKPFEYLEKGVNECSVKDFRKAFPDEYFQYIDNLSEEDIEDEFGGCKISLTILDKEKIDKDDLEKYDCNDTVPTAGYIVTTKIKVMQENYPDDTYTDDIPVVKVNGQWLFTDDIL